MVNLTPNVYAHWKLNESTGTLVSDSSVHGRDGTTVNMEDEDWVSGKINNCLLFDDTNTEYVDCENISNFDRFDEFSYEFWFKTNIPSTATFYAILGKRRVGPNVGMVTEIRTGQIWFGLWSHSTEYLRVYTSGTLLNDDVWHHCIITYDGSGDASGVHIYIDNVNKSLTTYANTLNGTIINSIHFQMSKTVGDWNYVGYLDEVVIYDKELSQEEVTFRWNGGAGTEDMADAPPTPPSNPDPADTATDIDYDQNLDWDCPDANTYDIYLGTSSPPAIQESDHPSSDYTIPFNLDSCTTYYWKIVAKGVGGETSSPEWSFTTNNELPTIPNTPLPMHNSVGQNLALILSWECEDYNPNDTLVYDIYFGTVNPPPLVKSNNANKEYSVSGLNFDKTYYWKIVARDNASCGTHETISPIWQFKTKEYVTAGHEAFDPRKIIRSQLATMHKIDGNIEKCIRVLADDNKYIYIPMYVEEEAELKCPALPFIRLDLLAIRAIPHDIKAAVRQHTALIGIDIAFNNMDNIDITSFGKKVADRLVDLSRYYQTATTGVQFMNIVNQGRLIIENRCEEVIFHWVLELEATYSDAC